MTRQRRLLASAALVALAVSVGLGACAPASEPESSEKTLRFAPSLFPVGLDPHKHSAEEAVQTAIQQVMEPLVRIEDSKFVPVLAKSWDTPDQNTWVFHLRKGVQFHDGSAFTAKDVVASYDRLIELEGSLVPLFTSVESFEATGRHTVTVKTAEPLGTLLSSLSLVFIGPAGQMKDEEFFDKPVGTGSFSVDDWTPGDHLTMAANPDYWGGKPKLDTLEFVSVPEVAGRITGLKTGELDLLTKIQPDQVSEVKGSDGVVYETSPSWTYYFIWFNSDRKPFTDKRVRQAMWHAVDVKQIVGNLFGDLATVAKGPIPQGPVGAPTLQPYEYDPKRAKKLLAEAGYPNGFKTSVHWPLQGGPNIRALARAFISDWAKIGVEVKPLEKERAKWLEDFGKLDWDMNLQTNIVATGDADYTIARLYLCEAKRNGYCNPELDKLLLEARTTLDRQERERLYQKAGEILWRDAVGIWPADLANNSARRERVKNFVMPASGRPLFADVRVTG